MIYERHFTVEEANALLDGLRPVLRQLRDASEMLTDAEVHSLLADAAPGNGGGEPGRQVGEAFLEVRRLLLAVQGSGIVIRDVDRGLIDFPAIRDSEEVYLCWELGEDDVSWWHELDAGFGGRQPLICAAGEAADGRQKKGSGALARRPASAWEVPREDICALAAWMCTGGIGTPGRNFNHRGRSGRLYEPATIDRTARLAWAPPV